MTSSSHTLSIAVLGGGPDAERDVSLNSSQNVADALSKNARFRVRRHVIGALSQRDLSAIQADVLVPILHGPWGEGGPLQDLLEQDGRPFVGCGSKAARLAMDKLASKLLAARCRIPTADAAAFNAIDHGCPHPFPVVVKPVHEGSSVGVHFATDTDSWRKAHAAVLADRTAHPHRAYMIERAVLGGRELTVGVLDGQALPPIEIKPKEAFYDYHAKYHSDDTKYEVGPHLPAGLEQEVQHAAQTIFREIGARHLARVDFLLDEHQRPWFLEVNTLPGFTSHSLFPMAAADRAKGPGLDITTLTTKLVDLALRDTGKR
jgi:D-alanine-D-alanine ligase